MVDQTDLTNNEKMVLLALFELEEAELSVIADMVDLNSNASMQSAFLLEEKGLAKVDEQTQSLYGLTAEGKIYAETGLPERQLINKINEPVSMEYARSFVDLSVVGIATGWVVKKGWAKIEKGKIYPLLKEFPEKDDDEKVLESLYENSLDSDSDIPSFEISEDFASEDTIKNLLNRKLLEKGEYTTRTISITDLGKSLVSKGIDIKEEINQITSDLLLSGEWKDKYYRPYKIQKPVKPVYGAKIHPYQRLMDEMRQIFLEMGFTEIKGDIIQSSFWNFDALFQPQDHPAREMQDTFHLDETSELPAKYLNKVKEMHETGGKIMSSGWGGKWDPEIAKKSVLRTHTTAVTIKYLAENPKGPVKAFCIDRSYRREAIDPTHTPEFEQLEGVVMEEGITFSHLLGLLKEFYTKMGFKEVRFRPGYFPYTEPSVEPEVYIDGLGWVELGGAGVFRKEVTEPLGITEPVLAWGLGVSRVAMLRLGLKDLRELYQSDIDWLRKSEVNTKK